MRRRNIIAAAASIVALTVGAWWLVVLLPGPYLRLYDSLGGPFSPLRAVESVHREMVASPMAYCDRPFVLTQNGGFAVGVGLPDGVAMPEGFAELVLVRTDYVTVSTERLLAAMAAVNLLMIEQCSA